MMVSFLSRLLAGISLLSTTAGVVYYVKPTEPCTHNSSCPSNETCQTMDHYVSNSSHYFSSDHINVTLYFMCGVHNCAQEMTAHDLQTFTMIGTAGRQYVTICMPIPGTRYYFLNISNTTIKDISVSHFSASFERNSKLNAIKVNFAGRTSFDPGNISSIVFDTASALFDSCTFQQNSFVFLLTVNINVTVHNCTFHSYNHSHYSPIVAKYSTLTLSGSVYFFNNSIGSPKGILYQYYGALYVEDTTLIVNDGACVYFINNTAYRGGAIFLTRKATMHIANGVNMFFLENKTRKLPHNSTYSKFGGGAIVLDSSFIFTETNAKLYFIKNSAGLDGGAILMRYQSTITLSSSTLVNFTSNVTAYTGGAISLNDGSSLNISANTSIYFRNNTAINKEGGALSITSSYLLIQNSNLFIENNSASKHAGGGIFMSSSSSLKVSKNSEIFFTANRAHLQGGAVYLSLGGNISIDSCSKLIITYNSANQGGAFYLTATAMLSVGSYSIVLFGYNTAKDRGGAVYANVELSLPCFLVLTNYLSEVKFEGNIAKGEIGMDELQNSCAC